MQTVFNNILFELSNEIAMVVKSQTEMKISPWLFHTTFKKNLFTYERRAKQF